MARRQSGGQSNRRSDVNGARIRLHCAANRHGPLGIEPIAEQGDPFLSQLWADCPSQDESLFRGSATQYAEQTMNVFISWAGEETREFASDLSEWLGLMLQELKTFVSCGDIEPGETWSSRIERELEATNYGILCVTRSNALRPWLNFEAGALSKQVSDKARVVPYLLEGTPADFREPLSRFGMVRSDRDGTFSLLAGLNAALDRPLKESALKIQFDAHWPRLDTCVGHVRTLIQAQPEEAPKRDTASILEEILDKVRLIHSNQGVNFHSLPRGARGAKGAKPVVANPAYLRQIGGLDKSLDMPIATEHDLEEIAREIALVEIDAGSYNEPRVFKAIDEWRGVLDAPDLRRVAILARQWFDAAKNASGETGMGISSFPGSPKE
jgi:hypothetical protein